MRRGDFPESVRGSPSGCAGSAPISQFHAPADRVRRRPASEIEIILALAPRDSEQRLKHFLAEAFLAQPVDCPGRAVLEHVVQNGDDARRFSLDMVHDALGMHDVGFIGLVLLARVGLPGDLDCAFERRHTSLNRVAGFYVALTPRLNDPRRWAPRRTAKRSWRFQR